MSGHRPGLAVERTVLAWTRTWLTVGVCGLLLLRLAGASPMRTAAALAIGAAALLVLTVVGRGRAIRLRALAGTAGPVPPAVRAAAATSATSTLLGLAAAVLVAIR